MTSAKQPDLEEIEAHFVALLEGRMSRDAVDRWAAQWVINDHLVWDELSWWALLKLHGIDLRHGTSDNYLHDDDQIRGWLMRLRRRRIG
ncbi:hypothetical protein ACGFNU_33745 [Spirillospora sp. NPDC048911]|uniref:hypothetical protein n=1 Tax=Spirillospora sp. NPDC048911 TaxID=3364527 RepID=UPI003712FD87